MDCLGSSLQDYLYSLQKLINFVEKVPNELPKIELAKEEKEKGPETTTTTQTTTTETNVNPKSEIPDPKPQPPAEKPKPRPEIKEFLSMIGMDSPLQKLNFDPASVLEICGWYSFFYLRMTCLGRSKWLWKCF